MFQFEQFPVYIKSEKVVISLQGYLNDRTINKNIRDQLYRSSSSIVLNIAEGAGKYSRRDKKNFYIIARGSVQETVSILRILKIEKKITVGKYNDIYVDLTEISKMLSGLIKKNVGLSSFLFTLEIPLFKLVQKE